MEGNDVGLANHLFGQRTPAEAAAAEAKKNIDAAEVAEKKCSDKVAGERLMKDRRHARVATGKQKQQEQHDLKAEARARHDASDSEAPFDSTPFDTLIAQWDAEIESRIEIANKQDEVFAAAVAALTEARREVRRARHRAQLPKVIEALRVLRVEFDALVALEGPDGAAAVSQELGLGSLMADTVGTERLASMYLNPPPRREAHPMELVRFVQDTSRIEGPMDGRGYNSGEAASFRPEVAARLVASGAAEWLIPNAENAKAAEQARKRLEQRPTYEGSARENVGWSNA
jgi:hypothetical protein